jgi:hypothetical protein
MPVLNRLEARTRSNSLRFACYAANRTVSAVRSFAESLFDDTFGGPGSGLAVQA